MKMKNFKKSLSFIFCAMLIVAMALCTTACNDKKETPKTQATANQDEDGTKSTKPASTQSSDDNVLGEGQTVFEFNVVDYDGNTTKFEIHTDKSIVGDALTELGLIEGEPGQYGLYVKTVNGITADYDKDKAYWAFYINDAYAMSGVDTTEIKEGEIYTFKVEKS